MAALSVIVSSLKTSPGSRGAALYLRVHGGVRSMHTSIHLLRSQRLIPRPRLAAACALLLSVTAFAACGAPSSTAATGPAKPLIAKDANGTLITIPTKAPQRIISLGSSDSDILGALHMDSHVIAVDAYTDYPADLAAKPKVAADANGLPVAESIVGLKPDLVLSYGGEIATTDKQLIAAGIQVVDLPALDLSGTLTEIRLVGQLVHAENTADSLVTSLHKRIDAIKQKVANLPRVSVYMEIDDSTPGKPYASGGGSFGNELIQDAGGTNIFASQTASGGYPQVSDESVIAANPQDIVLTEDPKYGGNPQLVYGRTGWSVISAVKNHQVYEIIPDLTQHGSQRLVDGLEKLAKDLHPDAFTK